MTFPATLTLVTVRAAFSAPPLGGGAGRVRYEALYPLIGASDNAIVRPFTTTAVLDADGVAVAELPATNDPQWVPQDWAYRVTCEVDGQVFTGTLQLDYQSTSVELADLLQVEGAAQPGFTYATAAQLAAVQEAVQYVVPVAVGESIQEAINDVFAFGGGTVALANGTHAVSSTIVMRTGVSLRGEGSTACRLSLASGANASVITSADFDSLVGTSPADPDLTASGPWGWSIEGLEIIGNKATQSGTSWGVRVWAYGYHMRDVIIRDCLSGGLYTQFAHTGVYSSTARGVESRFVDLQIHHNGGTGWECRGPNDSLAVGVLLWENSGFGFWARSIPGQASSNGVNLFNVHAYGSAHSWGFVFDAQVMASNCQSEGAGTGQVWVRYSDCIWDGGAIYDINPLGGNGMGLRLGDASTETFAVRAMINTLFNGWRGDSSAHVSVDFARTSNCLVVGRVGLTTAATNVLGGAPASSDVVNLAVSGGGSAAANSMVRLRGATAFDVGSAPQGFRVVNGNTDLFNINSASSRWEMPNAQEIRLYQGAYTNEKLRLSGSTGHVEVVSTTVPAVAAGVALGTSPPSVQIDATSNDMRGVVNFGTGTTPTTGAAVTVTFGTAFSRTPVVVAQARNSAGHALGVRVGALSASSFNINVEVAPAASQANTTYYVAYMVMG